MYRYPITASKSKNKWTYYGKLNVCMQCKINVEHDNSYQFFERRTKNRSRHAVWISCKKPSCVDVIRKSKIAYKIDRNVMFHKEDFKIVGAYDSGHTFHDSDHIFIPRRDGSFSTGRVAGIQLLTFCKEELILRLEWFEFGKLETKNVNLEMLERINGFRLRITHLPRCKNMRYNQKFMDLLFTPTT